MNTPSFNPEQDRLDLLQYLWTLQISDIKEGPFWRLRSWLISNAYNNGWILDRYCSLLVRAANELAIKLKENNIRTDVTVWAEKWSMIFSSYIQQSTGAHTNIYAEKLEHEVVLSKRELDTQQLLINLLKKKEVENIEIKPKTVKKMWFFRHNIDLEWAHVVLCEDTITTGETTEELIDLVENKWWNVVAIVCVWSRLNRNHIQWIPLFSCLQIDDKNIYYFHDDKTPNNKVWTTGKVPDWIDIIERWNAKKSENK